jgi:hypothetical protein
MARKIWGNGVLLTLCVLLLAGCSSGMLPVGSVAPTATPTVPLPPRQTTTTGCGQPPALHDSRATATDIVLSYYNAIDRQEFQRAYGYLTPLDAYQAASSTAPTPVPPPPIPSFQQWLAGYAQTACVFVTYTGHEAPVTSATAGYAGIGSGVVVPVTLTALQLDGTIQQFTGTYAVRYNPPQGMDATGYLALSYANLAQV